jgi:hypothetical protein
MRRLNETPQSVFVWGMVADDLPENGVPIYFYYFVHY